ncbi:IucA/IucC family protein [Streptomyces sp. ZYX-F-203]
MENLLRCWVRETDLPEPNDDLLRLPSPTGEAALVAPVAYWSPTGWHRFEAVRPADSSDHTTPVRGAAIAALLATDLAGRGASGAADLVARVDDSARRTALILRERLPEAAKTGGAGPADLFLTAEQALLLGHPTHPAPKSREGLTEEETRRYSPELRGAFPLHWLSVAPEVSATDSAWSQGGRTVTAARLVSRLAGAVPTPSPGHTLLPVHPWQMRQIRDRPDLADLLDSGLLRDLGVAGEPWHPTSSLRTVHQTGSPAMLKLSLALRITNSRRENLRKELHRGVEMHRLLRTGLAREWHAAHPDFDIVRDPAWIGVDAADGGALRGLDVVIRHNPFAPTDDVACLAGLVAPRPDGSPVEGSRLSDIVTAGAERTGRPRDVVGTEWFLRYLERVVAPVLWLDEEVGIALEAHQQNTLVLLDDEGWPIGGRHRDNQGYYYRESGRAELDARLPGIGEHSDTFVADEVADERLAYYLGVNNVCGLIGAFGSQRLADERVLLDAFRRFLARPVARRRRRHGALRPLLLDSRVLRCKANLLTRLHDLDELEGPVDTQSVYVALTNPLHG